MVCLVRNRKKFYRKTMLDVWGISYTYKKPTREIKFIRMMERERTFRKWYYRKEIVYSLKKKIRFRRKKREKTKYLLPRFLKHFYLILKLDDLRKIQRKAITKKGTFEANFLTMLECRLFMIVFRIHWITNIFIIKSMVDQGIFTVNGIRKRHSNFVAHVGDIISVYIYYNLLLQEDLVMRYKRRIVFCNTPDHMFINHKLMLSVFLRDPMYEDFVFYTDKLDIFLGSEYYFPTPR